jgi:tetratricopeptide (TPR) repeat protein
MIHNNLGIALAEQGRIDDAVSHYLLALQIQPDNAQALYNMGKEMSAKGRVDEAIDYYHS